MAKSLPRALRSALSEALFSRVSSILRSDSTQLISHRMNGAARQLCRPFSITHQQSATPASSYTTRKNGDTAKPAPVPSKQPSVDNQSPIQDMTAGLADEPLILDEGSKQVDWTRSFHGLSAQPFSKDAADVLLAPIPFDDVEVKPDGIIYLPEIKYRRILNKAFGPGGWGLAPRGETIVTQRSITREYALVAHGRSVNTAFLSK